MVQGDCEFDNTEPSTKMAAGTRHTEEEEVSHFFGERDLLSLAQPSQERQILVDPIKNGRVRAVCR